VTFFTPDEVEKFNSGKPIRCALLAEMDFVSKRMGAWNGSTKLTVNGTEFLPLFGAGSIEGLSFQNSTISKSITISIAGVDNGILGLTLASAAETQNRLVKIYLQMFDDDWQPIAAPPVIFFGYMQNPEITQDEVTQDSNASSPTQTISVPAENIWFNRSRAPGGRYTDRDQQLRSPGDEIFNFVPGLVFKSFVYPDF